MALMCFSSISRPISGKVVKAMNMVKHLKIVQYRAPIKSTINLIYCFKFRVISAENVSRGWIKTHGAYHSYI